MLISDNQILPISMVQMRLPFQRRLDPSFTVSSLKILAPKVIKYCSIQRLFHNFLKLYLPPIVDSIIEQIKK